MTAAADTGKRSRFAAVCKGCGDDVEASYCAECVTDMSARPPSINEKTPATAVRKWRDRQILIGGLSVAEIALVYRLLDDLEARR